MSLAVIHFNFGVRRPDGPERTLPWCPPYPPLPHLRFAAPASPTGLTSTALPRLPAGKAAHASSYFGSGTE